MKLQPMINLTINTKLKTKQTLLSRKREWMVLCQLRWRHKRILNSIPNECVDFDRTKRETRNVDCGALMHVYACLFAASLCRCVSTIHFVANDRKRHNRKHTCTRGKDVVCVLFLATVSHSDVKYLKCHRILWTNFNITINSSCLFRPLSPH